LAVVGLTIIGVVFACKATSVSSLLAEHADRKQAIPTVDKDDDDLSAPSSGTTIGVAIAIPTVHAVPMPTLEKEREFDVAAASGSLVTREPDDDPVIFHIDADPFPRLASQHPLDDDGPKTVKEKAVSFAD